MTTYPPERRTQAGQQLTPSVVLCVFVFASTLLAGAWPSSAQSIEDEIHLIGKSGTHPYAVGSPRAEWTDLKRIYELSTSAPLWLEDGRPSATADQVIERLSAIGDDGLPPDDYAASRLSAESTRLTTPPASARDAALFDTAMTLSLLRLVSDLYRGRIDPRAIGFRSIEAPPSLDRAAFVSTLARSKDPAAQLRQLDPPFPMYGRLRAALRRMLDLAAREPVQLPEGMPVLRPDESRQEVPLLRQLLATQGDLRPDDPSPLAPELYDPAMVDAVKSFQHRHGLEEDGIVGKATLQQMRVPPSERVPQIELAMERMRWLAEPHGERFIIVNIPAFRLLAFDKTRARPQLVMDVVVGKAARLNRTPIMQADMISVIFRPYWDVPPGIARREILPLVESDPSYLERRRMEMVNGRVRQRPGANNALGLVKFRLPNPYHVYLHDTPSRSLFSRARRDFSHGCIRLAKPAELAEFVLENRDDWESEQITEAMHRGKNNKHVPVQPPIPVYVLYSTAIVDADDRVHFFEDIYGHDVTLRRMLDSRNEKR